MTAVQPFDFHGTAVRTVVVDGEPWFVAADVARILGYGVAKDMTRSLDPEEKGGRPVPTPGGEQEMAVISEPGLYRAIIQRQTGRLAADVLRDQIRDFQRWVTRDVLPAIRRTGSYSVPVQRALPQSYAEALRELAATVEDRDAARAQVAELEPDARMARTCMSADGDWSVREAAQVLTRDPAISTGQRRLFGTLRELGWVDRRGTPYQRHIEAGRVSSRVRVYDHPHTGEPVMADPQVRITGKGLAELHRHLGGTAELVTEQLEVTR